MAVPRTDPFLSSLPAGECGQLIAARDWATTALGPIAGWPGSLRTATSILLRSPVPMVMLWGEDGVMLYNDAYSVFAGGRHPELLGKEVREGWPEVADFNDHVMRVGLAGGTLHYKDQELTLYRHGVAERVWMNLDYSPVLDERGEPAGVLCVLAETTARVAAERRSAFLLTLGDALRPLADPAAIQDAAACVLAEHLGAARVVYAEDAGDGEHVVLTSDYARGGPSIKGLYRYADYGLDLLAEMRAGRSVIRPDVAADPLLTDAEKDAHRVLGLGATLNVPLVKQGRLLAMLGVHFGEPHAFSRDEVDLAQEVAERTWAAVERARAEAALRASEERLSRSHLAARLGDFTWDVATDAITLSGDYPRLLGLARDALPTAAPAFLERIHPGDRDRVLAEAAPMLAGGSARFDSEYRVIRGDGGVAWLGVSAAGEGHQPDGRAARVVGVNYDVTDRREAEAALRESEARFRLMADATPQIIWITDAEGRTEFFNRQWTEYTGAAYEPSTAADIAANYVHPDDAAATVAAFDEARRTGSTFCVEHRIRSEAGAYRWFLVRGEPYRDPDTGAIVRWFGASVDIHDRRLAEERLRALNADLERQVVERSRERGLIWQYSIDLLSVIDLDSAIFDTVNPAWTATLGWRGDELEGRAFADFVHPDDLGVSGQAFEQVRRGDPVLRFSNRYRTRDGEWRWLAWVAVPEGGKLYSVTRDVTDERAQQARLEAAEAARREADRLYRAYFENTPEALFVIRVLDDGGFAVEQVNPAHEASVGFKLDDIRDRRIEDILPPDLSAQVLTLYRHVMTTGQIHQYRELFDMGDGPRHWDTSIMPVRDAEGRIVQLIGSSRDVTRQVVAEEALRQAQKMEAVGQLTGGIAHDFNNLLGAVVGSFDLIRRRADDADRVRRYAEAGLEAAERGAKLTGQLLAFSRAQRIELKPVVVADLVEGMGELLARTLGPMVPLHFALEGDGAVLSDPTQLEMAVLNLAINARDAMPDGGELTIGTRPYRSERDEDLTRGDYVELWVADTGTGMPPEVVARAFDPFFTTKGVGKGTGLGLSQVYGIARQAGGTVRIDSRVGEGTTIRILLPRTTAPIIAATDGEEATPAGAPAGVTVLVVDDDPDLRRMLVASLDALGYRVTEAADGPAGLAALETAAPDLMMVDFAMLGMNGAEVARAARTRRPDLPIVFASGYSDTDAIEAAVGPDAPVLRKPFRIDDLQALLASVLRARTAGAVNGNA